MKILPFVLITACNGDSDDADADDDADIEEYYSGNAGWYDYDDDDEDGVVNQWDCAPDNPEAYPGAEEICGNGVDEDCDGLIDGDRTLLNEYGEACNGMDDDGDGAVDEGYADYGAGYRDTGGDGVLDCWLAECDATEITGTIIDTSGDTAIDSDTAADTGLPPAMPARNGGIDWGWAEPVRTESTRWLRQVIFGVADSS